MPPAIALDKVSLAYGHEPLLDAVDIAIDPRERVALIGRNGTGKSSLLSVLAGIVPPDAGRLVRPPGLRVATLPQDVAAPTGLSVFDTVAAGLGDLASLVAEYHRLAVAVARQPDAATLEALGRLQQALEERDGWRLEQRVDTTLTALGLDPDAIVDTLSGGWRRRVLLARALVGEPDVLLLDEPTNHLDIGAIAWLERLLATYPGAIVVVTHDRAFLDAVATRIVELDRGRLTSWPGTYRDFVAHRETRAEVEALQAARQDKRLASEEAWLRRGVKARRTRDEGRVRQLMALRAERAARRASMGSVKLGLEHGAPSGRLVIETDNVSKAFDGRPVITGLSTRVMRGDKIGIIGPNGAGKTTLLRLLAGELVSDSGEVVRGTNVTVAYFDQEREQLDPDATVFDTVGGGNDTVVVDGEPRHVHGYLRDFLFPPERAQSPVKALSGGERNRLLLARLLARPVNVLVLDEPTNDLDIETLELLEAALVGWPGTLLLVSHDRTFLDNVVTSTMDIGTDGRVHEYVGGYQDWLRQRPVEEPAGAGPPAVSSAASAATSASPAAPMKSAGSQSSAAPVKSAVRLSYHEVRELDALPATIERLEAAHAALTAEVSAPEFYKASPGEIADTLARLEALDAEILDAYGRWEALEGRAQRR